MKSKEERYKDNEKYLLDFKNDLFEKGLSENAIDEHLENADIYINNFSVGRLNLGMGQGDDVGCIYLFYTFLMENGADSTDIKMFTASLKRFYDSMLKHGSISKEEYDEIMSNLELNRERCITEYLDSVGEQLPYLNKDYKGE